MEQKGGTMSTVSSTITGYGIDLSGVSMETLYKFALKHATTKEYEILSKLTPNNYESFFNTIECPTSGIKGPGAYVSMVICRENNINVAYYCNYDLDGNKMPAVIFAETYPWTLTEIEKTLTMAILDKIYKPCQEELGITKEPDSIVIG